MKNMIAKIMSALVVVAMIAAVLPMKTAAAETQDTLILGMQDDASNINYFDPDTNSVWKSNQLGWNFEALVAYTPDFQLYPVLAAKKTTGPNGVDVTTDTADGLNLTMKIRTGVTFTDGTPLTAKDVAFSYQVHIWGLYQTSIQDPLLWDSKTFTSWNGTGTSYVGVEAPDSTTVKFHLKQPFALFWYGTLGVPILPSHIWNDHLTQLSADDLSNFGLPSGAVEYKLDYGYGQDSTEMDATVGTGPWKMTKWTKSVESQVEVYTGYWDKAGKTVWAGKSYSNYPDYIRTIKFKQYGTLDVSILALQKGEIHYIPWNIGFSFYNSLKTDPNIGFEIPQDQGFFYLAFNMKKSPMSNLAFRKAVSYCIDKDYIVNSLLGGYGAKGTVPISITNSRYVNETVPEWMNTMNFDKAKAALDAANIKDTNADGWREMPDGTAIKLSILTPPKDYDPIRADSGIMISKNLKSIGLNIEASPTNFNTIVAAAYSSNPTYDMFVLGWTVGSFPELYLPDFFATKNDVRTNSAGSNSPGYSNPAVDTKMDAMMVEMDTAKRATMVKDICGVLMNELPYNTLFYRKNIEGYRQDIWQGWTRAFGTLYNGFSLNSLHPPGSGGSTDTGEGGGGGAIPGSVVTTPGTYRFNGAMKLDAVIDTPEYGTAGSDLTGRVLVSQTYVDPVTGVKSSKPAFNATVNATMTYNIAGTNYYVNNSVKSDASGVATFNIKIPYTMLASVNFYANASMGAAWVKTKTSSVLVSFPNKVAQLSLYTNDGVLPISGTGNSTVVYAKVTDLDGTPISGVKVFIDNKKMLGNMNNYNASYGKNMNMTNSTGITAFTYRSPGVGFAYNMNLYDLIGANITSQADPRMADAVVPEVQSASLIIGLENTVYDWNAIDVTSVANYILDNDAGTAGVPASTTIAVKVTDSAGAAVANRVVTINLSVPATTATYDAKNKVTDVAGVATFTVTLDAAYTGSTQILVKFNTSKASCAKDSVVLFARNDRAYTPTEMHVNVTSVSDDMISTAGTFNGLPATTMVEVHLMDAAWADVADTKVGIIVDSPAAESVGMEATTDANGVAFFNVTAKGTAMADVPIGFAVADSVGVSQGYIINVNYQSTGAVIPVLNETVFQQFSWNELVDLTLANQNIINCTLYKWTGTSTPTVVAPANYTLDTYNGTLKDVTELMSNGYMLSAYYNYTDMPVATPAASVVVSSATVTTIDSDVLSTTPNTAMIQVTAAAGTKVYALLAAMDPTGLSLDVPSYVADIANQAYFNVTTTSTVPRSFVVYFNTSTTHGITDSVVMYNGGPIRGYAANIDFTQTSAAAPLATLNMRAQVWDETGAPAVGEYIQFYTGFTQYGVAGSFVGGDTRYYSDMDFDIGDYKSYIGSWKDGFTNASGGYSADITTKAVLGDVPIDIEVGIGTGPSGDWMWSGTPTFTSNVNGVVWGGPYNEPCAVNLMDSGILKRAPLATMTKAVMNRTYVSMQAPAGKVTLTFQNLAGPIQNAQVKVYKGLAKPPILTTQTTNSAGTISANFNATSSNSNSAIFGGFTATMTQAGYAQFPSNFFFPYLATDPVNSTYWAMQNAMTTQTPVIVAGESGKVNVTVKNQYGKPISGVSIEQAEITMTRAAVVTNANGTAQVTGIKTTYPSTPGFVPIKLTLSKANVTTSTEMFYIQTVSPDLMMSVEYSKLNVTVPLINEKFDVTFSALNNWSYAGHATFGLMVDNQIVNQTTVDFAGLQAKNVTFKYALLDTTNHNITVKQIGATALPAAMVRAGVPPSATLLYSNAVVPTNATVGTSVTFSVDVKNNGTVAETFYIPFTVDGKVYYVEKAITAGQTTTVEMAYTFATDGSHNVAIGTLASVVVDVAAVEVAKKGFDAATLGAVAAVMLLVGLVIGFFLVKMLGKKKPEETPAPKPAPKATPKPAPKPEAPKTEAPLTEEKKQ
jgi:peptide/nickel transport system substrate-binding protein